MNPQPKHKRIKLSPQTWSKLREQVYRERREIWWWQWSCPDPETVPVLWRES